MAGFSTGFGGTSSYTGIGGRTRGVRFKSLPHPKVAGGGFESPAAPYRREKKLIRETAGFAQAGAKGQKRTY